MRVLYLSDVCAPRVNGVSTSIAIFRRELGALGVEVPLIAPRYGEEPLEPGVIRLRGRSVPFDREDRFVTPGAFVAAADALDFELVHVQTPFAAHIAGVRLARSRRVPLFETWHTDFEHYFEHYVPVVPRALARLAARVLTRRVAAAVDRLVVPSQEIDDALRRDGIATPRAVVPTGLATNDLGAGDGAAFRQRHGISATRPVAVHVGRIAHEKNIDFLLRAVALARRELPDILLIVAGEGPAKRGLERLAVELGLAQNILWLGYLDRATELADVYRAGDLFAFASRTETQGLVLIEAMSLGVPVVALAERGTRDLLAVGRGGLVPGGSEDEFASALVRLLRDRDLRDRLSEEARDLARSWTAPQFAARMANLYAAATGRTKSREVLATGSPSTEFAQPG